MNRLFIILIVVSLGSCRFKTSSMEATKEADSQVIRTEIINNENISDKLKKYFELFRIKPSVEINNTDNQTEIQLGGHKIKWLNDDDETKIKIDNDLFSLNGYATLNLVWDRKDSVNFANEWDEIKLFKHKNKEYIGIQISFFPCTGLACSVNYYLIYDVQTKSKNFFGTFRTGNELELFDFLNDDKIDYISKTYIGQSDGVAEEITHMYELYSMETTGKFSIQVDNNNKSYFIKRTFNAESNKEIVEKFESNWITKIQ